MRRSLQSARHSAFNQLKFVVTSLILLCMVLIPCLVNAQSKVRVATYPDYEPFCFYKPGVDTSRYFERIDPTEESKLFTGLAWEVVLASFQQQNYHVELYIVPWARAMKMLEQGLVDAIFPAVKTPEREERYRFSQQVVYPANGLLLYSKRGKLPDDYLPSLQELRIGVVRSFSYGKRWAQIVQQHQLNVSEMRSLPHAFKMLENDRIDVLPGYELSHDYFLQQKNKVELFDKSRPFDHAYSYLMFRKEKAKALLDFDQGRAKLEQQGTYHKMLEYWSFPPPLND